MRRKPNHPGAIFNEEFLNYSNLSIGEFSKLIKVDKEFLSDVISGKKVCNLDLATKISIYTGTSSHMWLQMQKNFDLWNFQYKSRHI